MKLNTDLKFERVIFLGNGEYSSAEVKRLHRLVNEAIVLMGGLQQGHPDMSSEELDEEFEVLKTYVFWIMNAFGFDCEWHELQDLPYLP